MLLARLMSRVRTGQRECGLTLDDNPKDQAFVPCGSVGSSVTCAPQQTGQTSRLSDAIAEEETGFDISRLLAGAALWGTHKKRVRFDISTDQPSLRHGPGIQMLLGLAFGEQVRLKRKAHRSSSLPGRFEETSEANRDLTVKRVRLGQLAVSKVRFCAD